MKIHNTQYNLHNTKLHRVFFYLLLLFLPSQLGYHLWPEWALVLGRRIDYLSPTLFFTDVLIILTLGCWLWEMRNRIVNRVLGIVYRVVRGKLKNFYVNRSFVIFCAPLLFILANVVYSLSPAVSLYHWMKFLEFSLLAYYVVKTKPPLVEVQNVLFVALLYSSIIGIAQFYFQHSLGGVFWLLGERTFNASTPGIAQIPIALTIWNWNMDMGLVLRSYGTFPHPNVFGGFLAVVLPQVVYRMLHTSVRFPEKSKKNDTRWTLETILLCSSLVLGSIALVLTFSRSAWVVGVVGILYSVWRIAYSEKSKQKIRYTQYLLLILVACIGLFTAVLPSKTSESVVVRLALQESSFGIWQTQPWLGVGMGNFLVALPSFLPSAFIYFLQPVHNIYLLLLSEVGILGICLIIYVFYRLVYRIPYRVSSVNKYTIHNTQYALPMVQLLVLGLVDHYPLTIQQGQLLFSLLIGMSLALKLR